MVANPSREKGRNPRKGSGDSRTLDRLTTKGTRAKPISLPRPSIFKGSLQNEVRGGEKEGGVPFREKGGRIGNKAKPGKGRIVFSGHSIDR